MTLPDTAFQGDTGHIADHNAIVDTLSDVLNELSAYPTRTAGQGHITSLESTTSTSYADLATPGPAVTVPLTAGQPVLILVNTRMWATTTGQYGYASFAVSGAASVAANDGDAIVMAQFSSAQDLSGTKPAIYVATITGDHTFTMKYRTTDAAKSVVFATRRIIVVPLLP